MSEPLLRVRSLRKEFPIGPRRWFGEGRSLVAVNDVSFDLERGESLGLVGESGCGKSTTARAVIGLLPPTSGSVRFDGTELVGLSKRAWTDVHRRMQMIFQDPYASLDPRQTVGSIVGEPLVIHRMGKPRERKLRVLELLDAVGLDHRHLNRYPHEFSGGQRQRIGIARSLALEPELLICDEPVSALDVSIQAQVINLLKELQERMGLSYLFIAHDLAVVRHLCSRVAVMYLGEIVEEASRNELYDAPRHPYTQALLSAVPTPDPDREKQRKRIVLQGDVPNPIDPPTGCAFHPRCPHVKESSEDCATLRPELGERRLETGEKRRFACHLAPRAD